MSMDGRFYSFLAKELNVALENARIQKIYQLSKTDFLFIVRGNKETLQLSLSLSTTLSRIHLTMWRDEKPDNPSGFCMFLRKYLEGGTIENISSINQDRIIRIKVENLNEIGDITHYHVYMESFGRYANLIIADDQDIIIDSYKKVSPTETEQRTIIKGAHYQIPETSKVLPTDYETDAFFETEEVITDKMLTSHFQGLSPVVAKYILSYKDQKECTYKQAFQSFINAPVNPTSAIMNEKQKYYYFDIFPESTKKTTYHSLSELIDIISLESVKIERMKQISKTIYQLAKREYEKNRNKLEKLSAELEDALSSNIYRIKGDLIYQNLPLIHKGDGQFVAFDYETNQEVKVNLDRLLDPKQNAAVYYKKYKKAKNAVTYITEQIHLTKQLIDYFDLLVSQIETAAISDIEEIKVELTEKGYLRKKGKVSKKKLPSFETYYSSNDTAIYVGKNNIQNEYLTHKLARNEDYWFHTKDAHGSHVIVKTAELDEEIIRMASNLAASFSKARLSSSVPVDYTQIKYVKKTPGEMASFVNYTHQKTIYIDPDMTLIAHYKKKKSRD